MLIAEWYFWHIFSMPWQSKIQFSKALVVSFMLEIFLRWLLQWSVMLGSHISDPTSPTICDAENNEVVFQKLRFTTIRQISWSITISARPSLALVGGACDHRRQSEERSWSDRLCIAIYWTFRRLHAGSHRETFCDGFFTSAQLPLASSSIS